MTTYTAFTTLRSEASAYQLSDMMDALHPEPMGIGTFEIEDGSGYWEVAGYFTQKPDEAGLALLASMAGAQPFVISKVPDRDWVAQVRRELTPVEAGRFIVFGSHDAALVPVNRIGLQIDAAMAFGTGHHGTTLGCLRSYDRLLRAGLMAQHVADIGTGTGVLAMAAARTGARHVIASDMDPVAIATARVNMTVNGLGTRVRCVTAPGFKADALRQRAPYDLVFANILAGPLKRLARDMAAHTDLGSVVILSGILNRQAAGVVATYRGHGFACEHREVIGEWTTLTLRRG